MSFYFLVEGRRTETRVYRAWLKLALPNVREVQRIQDLDAGSFLIICGNGYPSIVRRIEATLRDIAEHPSPVEHYFVSLDSDDAGYRERHDEIMEEIEREMEAIDVRRTQPSLHVHVIVQHCCIETWFLGNRAMMPAAPRSAELVQYKEFFDVSERDPELLPAHPDHPTRSMFHGKYVHAMLEENGKRYSKRLPSAVMERSYFDALCKRCMETPHLQSLRTLLDAWGITP